MFVLSLFKENIVLMVRNYNYRYFLPEILDSGMPTFAQNKPIYYNHDEFYNKKLHGPKNHYLSHRCDEFQERINDY